ncbi:hypothetical protein ACFQ3W_18675 [Paenibacillus puldeungensis]|uniref:Adhesin domain-containing protein n=1 Tax=Paenibacillus puldeungensis TaxID=696536 RepID=A0ABW3S1I9_9BACL
MKSLKLIWLGITTATLILLTGCGGLQNDVEQAIGKTKDTFGEAVKDAATWKEELAHKGVSKELKTEVSAGSAKSVFLDNAVGSIEVKPTTGDQIKVKATIWSINRPSFKGKQEKVFEQSTVRTIVNGDQVKITTSPKDDAQMDLWKWAKKQWGFSEFSIDYQVELPANITEFHISNDVGDIKLTDLKGAYQVASDVGTVKISGAQISGKSSVKASTGSLELGIAAMSDESSLEAVADVGSIRTTLSKTLACTLNTKSELGKITGAEKGKSDVNGGGPLVSLSTSIGSITID